MTIDDRLSTLPLSSEQLLRILAAGPDRARVALAVLAAKKGRPC